MSDASDIKQDDSDRNYWLSRSLNSEVLRRYKQIEKDLGYSPDIKVDFNAAHVMEVMPKSSEAIAEFVVPRNALKWTMLIAPYFSDKELSLFERPAPEIQQVGNKIAKSSGTTAPIIILDDNLEGGSTVFQSKEGTVYLLLQKRNMNEGSLVGTISHEIGHIANKHQVFSNWLSIFREGGIEALRQAESVADKHAIEACFGPDLVRGLVNKHADLKHEMHQKGVSLDAYYAADSHVHGLHRVADVVNEMIKLQTLGVCPINDDSSPATNAAMTRDKSKGGRTGPQ